MSTALSPEDAAFQAAVIRAREVLQRNSQTTPGGWRSFKEMIDSVILEGTDVRRRLVEMIFVFWEPQDITVLMETIAAAKIARDAALAKVAQADSTRAPQDAGH